jgi:6,7-dimethyl-8-ribityllumazine synthase
MHILIVEAPFYTHIAAMQRDGVTDALKAAGATWDVISVPGALEVPAAIALAEQSGKYDGYVALGCVIRGETYHFEVVAGESARAIMALTLDGLAIGNGILTVENEAQAIARADKTQKNKGGEALAIPPHPNPHNSPGPPPPRGGAGHGAPEAALRLKPPPAACKPCPRHTEARWPCRSATWADRAHKRASLEIPPLNVRRGRSHRTRPRRPAPAPPRPPGRPNPA